MLLSIKAVVGRPIPNVVSPTSHWIFVTIFVFTDNHLTDAANVHTSFYEKVFFLRRDSL